MQTFHFKQAFPLLCGQTLPEVKIAYHTYGKLNAQKNNVVWVIHALTANSDVFDWWNGLFGDDALFNPKDYFIVCANNLGSCYGTTGPQSPEALQAQCAMLDFPLITITDMVNAHQLLAKHLGIEQIQVLIGGSQGGQQALEWACVQPKTIEKLVVLATNAKHSPWGIAFNQAQRMAILADQCVWKNQLNAGADGLAAARAIAMLSYRSYETYAHDQTDELAKIDNFKASSYQSYQGIKLQKRFNAYSYLTLSKAMDSHNLARNFGSIENALAQISAQTLVIGISSDGLFPLHEQKLIAKHIKNAIFQEITSIYGHDGFLVETEKISLLVKKFIQNI